MNSKEGATNLEENKRKKKLEKKIFDNSPILRNSPRPVEVYEEKGNLARKSLFFFYSPPTNQPNKKFVYLTKKVFLRIDPEPSHDSIFASASSYWQEKEFRERTNQN